MYRHCGGALLQNERDLGSGILAGCRTPQTKTPAEAIRRGSCLPEREDQNFAPTETVKVAGGAQPWKNTVGSDCVR